MDDAKIAWKIREQMAVFSGNVSQGLPKVSQRLVREVLYGVQARGSVRLSEIGRSLGEATRLKKIIERLGRQLERSGRTVTVTWVSSVTEGSPDRPNGTATVSPGAIGSPHSMVLRGPSATSS
ncbi:MAG: hypothetical protein GY719_30130 [bacterium]|nr:hypothetical protein [bacterium]